MVHRDVGHAAPGVDPVDGTLVVPLAGPPLQFVARARGLEDLLAHVPAPRNEEELGDLLARGHALGGQRLPDRTQHGDEDEEGVAGVGLRRRAHPGERVAVHRTPAGRDLGRREHDPRRLGSVQPQRGAGSGRRRGTPLPSGRRRLLGGAGLSRGRDLVVVVLFAPHGVVQALCGCRRCSVSWPARVRVANGGRGRSDPLISARPRVRYGPLVRPGPQDGGPRIRVRPGTGGALVVLRMLRATCTERLSTTEAKSGDPRDGACPCP